MGSVWYVLSEKYKDAGLFTNKKSGHCAGASQPPPGVRELSKLIFRN